MPSVSAADIEQSALRRQKRHRKVEQKVGRPRGEALVEKSSELLVLVSVNGLHARHVLVQGVGSSVRLSCCIT